MNGSESSIRLAVASATTDLFGSSMALRLVHLPSTARGTAGCALQLWHVSASTRAGVLGLSAPAFAAASPTWMETAANISDVLFGGKGPGGSDQWLVLAGGSECEARVHMVEVRKPAVWQQRRQ